MTSRLLNIKKFGQKIWLDNLSRQLINSQQLQHLIAHDGIAGITSNPTIFYNALSKDSSYQEPLAKLKNSSLTAEERYEQLIIPDIIAACKAFLPLYHDSNGEDGYVSFEVSPYLAHDTLNTIAHGKRLWQQINMPNLMIKIPATTAGLKAFTELTALGINVNITLLFSQQQVLDTWEAYVDGLQQRLALKQPLQHIKAVASLFLSRIDSIIDGKLPEYLQGQTAISIAKLAYNDYQQLFHGDRFKQLKVANANAQYLLFASTGTKNPKYSDVLYVENLIGMETINTVPEATLNAFRDHGNSADTLANNLAHAQQIITEVSSFVDLTELGEKLQANGLELFMDSYQKLLELV